MIDWLININKDYPDFWKNYLSKFESKSSNIIVFSTETSGMNPSKDVILSIGSFAIENNSIAVGKNFEAVLLQYKYFHDNPFVCCQACILSVSHADASKVNA